MPVLRKHLQAHTNRLSLKGTILIATEGINSTISGSKENIQQFQEELTSDPRFSDIVFKESFYDDISFRRMLVKIKKEIDTNNLYRKFLVDYKDFSSDFDAQNIRGINTLELIAKTKKLFEQYQLSTDWKIVEKVEPEQLINSLSMICPFTISEKQRLLETKDITDRNEVLNKIINFYVLGNNENNNNIN